MHQATAAAVLLIGNFFLFLTAVTPRLLDISWVLIALGFSVGIYTLVAFRDSRQVSHWLATLACVWGTNFALVSVMSMREFARRLTFHDQVAYDAIIGVAISVPSAVWFICGGAWLISRQFKRLNASVVLGFFVWLAIENGAFRLWMLTKQDQVLDRTHASAARSHLASPGIFPARDCPEAMCQTIIISSR